MARKAVKWFGLALIGAAAFSCLRRLRRRSGPDGHEPPAPSSPPDLAAVPEPAPAAVPQADAAPAPEPEPELESSAGAGADVSGETDPDTGAPTDAGGPRWVDPIDEGCPPGYPIKVNERSGIYHVPGGLSYERTSPTRCYPDEAAAEADGFRRAKR